MADRKKTSMSTRYSRSIVVMAAGVAVALLAASPVRAQSLADVAKKEEERRHKTNEPTKVYTNKDLKGGPEPAASPPSQTPAAEPPKDAAKAKAGDGDKEGDAKNAKDP